MRSRLLFHYLFMFWQHWTSLWSVQQPYNYHVLHHTFLSNFFLYLVLSPLQLIDHHQLLYVVASLALTAVQLLFVLLFFQQDWAVHLACHCQRLCHLVQPICLWRSCMVLHWQLQMAHLLNLTACGALARPQFNRDPY